MWGILLGVWLGIQDRLNDRMVQQGVRPPWSARHPFIAMGLTVAVLFPTMFFGLAGLVWLFATAPALTAVLVVVLICFISTRSYRRADRRWPEPPKKNDDHKVIDVKGWW